MLWKAWIAWALVILGPRMFAATFVGEEFATDPVAGGRFERTLTGTESAFVHQATNQNLLAVLDVDFDPAFYLSTPFAAVTQADDVSFSFRFRITALDTLVPPAAFIGLLTTNHVALGGDGLTVALSSLSNGMPAFTATVDQGAGNSGGESVPLALATDYAAVARYTSSTRQFTVEVFGGAGFANLVGRSIAHATNGSFSVNRLGLQNNGGTAFDYTNGSITVEIDELFLPAQPPVLISIATNIVVAEGDEGTTNAVFTVSLSSPSVQTVRVDFATESLTAEAGFDFLPQAGTLVFAPGETTRSILVPVLGNRVAQPNRAFRVVLGNGANGGIIASSGEGTILDDDECLISISDAVATEPANGTADAIFTVSLSLSNVLPVSVSFATSDGTAAAGDDYAATSGLLVFAPGVTSVTCTVAVHADALDEEAETFLVNLSGWTNGLLDRGTGQCVITNSSPPPSVSISAATNVVEGAGAVVALLSLTPASGRIVTVNYATLSDTALAGEDFVAAAGFVTFTPGQTSAVISIAIATDTLRENAESFFVDITGATNAVRGNSRETVTIYDDDPVPTIDITDTGVREGDSGTTNAMFLVSLSNPTIEAVTVNFATTNGTAEAGSDYTAMNGTLTWAPGESSTRSILVPVIGDMLNEADETFGILLDSPTNAALAKSQALCTVTNDDFVSISISDGQVVEGNGGSTSMVFTVSLSGPSAQQVTVRFTTSDGSASAGGDYAGNSGVLTFTTNTTQRITVGVLGDVLDEPDETFFVTLSDLENAVFARQTGTGTILDDDLPAIQISDVEQNEEQSNVAVFTFQLTLTSPGTDEISVNFFTSNGTALAGSDYAATNGLVVFPPGQINASIAVLVFGDTLFESNEFFYVALDAPANATLASLRALGKIVNDDTPPVVTLDDTTLVEGTCTNVQITLSATSGLPVVVRYCVTNLPANVFLVCDTNCAVNMPTNVPPACQARCCDLVIPPGVLSMSFQVCAERNGMDDPQIVGGGSIEIRDGSGESGNATNRIVLGNVDPPHVLAADVAVVEGNNGFTNLCFTLQLTSARDTNIAVDFVTSDGTALANGDYLATNGTVVFQPGQTMQTVCIAVAGDLFYEGHETLWLRLTNAIHATLPVSVLQGTILDDDLPPALSIGDVAVVEGDSGTNYAVFTVSADPPTGVWSSVAFMIFDGTASSISDYVRDVGWLQFEPGSSNVTITVPVLGDTLDEPDEHFTIVLRDPVNAIITRGEATGLILDDDPPEIRVSNPAVLEGHDGAANVLLFEFTLSSASTQTVTVEFLTLDGTATSGADYVPTNGLLTFAAGQLNATVVVPVLGETLTELNETLFLCLTNAVNGTVPVPKGFGAILDDDAPCVSAQPAAVREAPEGPTNLVFTVTLDHASTLEIAVSYMISNGTALAGADYIAQSGTLIFSNGVTAVPLSIMVNNDLLMEPDETLLVHFSNPVNALVCAEPVTGTILDGTAPPVITVADVLIVEGNGGTRDAVFPVTLSRASPQMISFDLATSDGTAIAGEDYLPQAGTVTFLPGMISNSFAVPIVGDCRFENDDTFFVDLANVVFAVLATNRSLAVIQNDDAFPTVYIDDATVREGDEGITNAVFHLRLSCASAFPASISYATLDGTATAGSDYVTTNGRLFFPAGETNATVSVPVLGDTVIEADESFDLLLFAPGAVIPGASQATGLILDDDGVLLDISPAQASEGSTAFFTLTLSKPAGSEVTVNFATADDSALALLDYVPTNVLVRFAAGTTNQTQGVHLLADSIEEPDETFFVLLSSPVRATLATNRTLGTIWDGTPPCFSIFDASAQDDGSGNQSVSLAVTLNTVVAETLCVRFTTSNGTAIAGSDYIATEGVLCFEPGETNGQIAVRILPNTRDETNEFFYVVLSSATNATLCRAIASATIINPLVSNAPPVVALGALPACLTLPADLPLTATAFDPDGRINRVDFYAGTKLLGFCLEPPYAVTWRDVPPGLHSLFAVAIDNVGAASTSAPVSLRASYPASISIDDVAVVESHTGTNALFTLLLSSANCRTVTVDVLTSDVTALAGSDYIATWTNLIFLPGETVKLLPVPVLGDTTLEPDETFLVCLTNEQNVTLARACGVGTILDDDTNTFPFIALETPGDCILLPTDLMLVPMAADPDGTVERVEFYNYEATLGVCTVAPFEFFWTNVPSGLHRITAVAVDNLGARSTSAPVTFSASFPASLSIDDQTVVESVSGTNAVFTLTLASASCRAVSIEVATADGSAVAGLDYVAVRTNFTFLPGETEKQLSVRILGDSVPEPDETFFVCLTNQQYATLVRGCGVGTILNDDTNQPPAVALALPGYCFLLPTNLLLVADASDPDDGLSRVEFFNGAAMLGMCSAPPFEFSWTNVPPGEHLLTAVAVDNSGARATSAPVIISASFPATLSIDDQTVVEGNTMTNAVFTLSLSSATCHTVTVEVVTLNGTALAGLDYQTVSTMVTFLPGEMARQVSVPVMGDTLIEPDEIFLVCLTNQQYATLARACGIGTILNDDTNQLPAVALALPGYCFLLPTNLLLVADASDPDDGLSRVEFFSGVTMLGACSTTPYEFSWTNVPAGEHRLTAVAVDNSGARATSAPVVITASFPATLNIDDRTVVEGDTMTNVVFTLSLSSANCHTVTVEVLTIDGTALAGLDYQSVRTTVAFLPGEIARQVSVPVMGDTLIEPDEIFFLCLTNQQYATLARGCGIGTILNDDTEPPANLPPSVAIISPTNGAVFVTPPGLVPIVAQAEDTDGIVTQVEFFSEGAFIGADTNQPFMLLWTNTVPGNYTLTAIATDDDGATGTSAPVSIVIRTCTAALDATPLADQTRCVCDEVMFSTTVTTPDPYAIVWRANGTVIPGETNSTLLLQGLKPQQAGIYTVEVMTECAALTRSATLTLVGAGNMNPVPFSNAAPVTILSAGPASAYPSTIQVNCIPGPLKHVAVTLDGFGHNFPDDVDILLVSPGGQALKLMSDAGGGQPNKLTNVVLTFTDTATDFLPDASRISAGIYRPTDHSPADAFPPPAPQAAETDFTPFLGTDPNGAWSLYIFDDTGGDSGAISNGWKLSIEWHDPLPRLSAPQLLADGRFQMTLEGLPRMTHVIEASTDFVNWSPVSTNTPASAAIKVFDKRPGREPYRFYRAVRCP